MALIKCPECGHGVSDKATSCPNCGYILEKREVGNKSEEPQNQPKKEKDNRKKIAIGIGVIVLVIIVIGGINLFKKGGLVDQLTDKEAPKLKNVPTELTYYVGDEVNFEDVIKENNIQAVDNVDSDVNVKVDSNQVKLDEPGNYVLTLKAEDRAKNETEAEVSVQLNDYETHKAYLAATTLDQSKLEKSNSGGYVYDGISISDSEVQNFEDGTMYRAISKQLEGFYLFGKMLYSAWNTQLPVTVFGVEKPSSYDEMKPYVDSVSKFVTPYSTLPQILTWLQRSSVISGDFNYEEGSFSFDISDLTQAAKDMGISEKMLGYTLATLEEYAPKTQFKGNAYSCKLDVTGNVKNSNRNILTAEDFNTTQGSMFNPSTSENMMQTLQELGDDTYRWACFDSNMDLSKGSVIATNRDIQIGMSYNSVIYEYGKGTEATVDLDNDIAAKELEEAYENDGDDAVKLYYQQVKSYCAYQTQDGTYEMVFFFDENKEVSWIWYDNKMIYI